MELLTWLEASLLGQAVRGAGVWSYAVINLVHILGVATLFGSVLVLDLKLMGLFLRAPLGTVSVPTVPLAALGFAVAAASGVCLLATNASEYRGNPFLLIKFGAIFAALANFALVHRSSAWRARGTNGFSRHQRMQLAVGGAVSTSGMDHGSHRRKNVGLLVGIQMKINRHFSNLSRVALLALAGLTAFSCATAPPPPPEAPLVPIRVAGARWIELSPVLVAANSFYPQKITVPSGGVASMTRNETDLATNAETQLLRESVNNPDLRIIMTVSESFYRLVGRRSSGISKLADLKGKRVLLPRNTSAQYYMVAMLRSAGLKEEDVTVVNLPAAPAGAPPSKFRMAEALARGEADFMATFEPEPEQAVRLLGKDAIVLQDRKVYREAFNLHARAPDLADPEKRRAIVAFVKATAQATKALKKDPKPYLAHISSVLGFTEEQIGCGWPETEFPVEIIPDMLDVLETEEVWVASLTNRAPRSRAQLEKFIDRSVVKEALASR